MGGGVWTSSRKQASSPAVICGKWLLVEQWYFPVSALVSAAQTPLSGAPCPQPSFISGKFSGLKSLVSVGREDGASVKQVAGYLNSDLVQEGDSEN